MNIPVEILKTFNGLKSGKVYYGDLAKNNSSHAAVVVAVLDDVVHYFCFTSQQETVKRYVLKDPEAGIKLSDEERKIIFPESEKDTFIYCGRANWCKKSEKEFLQLLSTSQITLRAELPAALFEKIKNAIRSSETFSVIQLKEMGLIH